MLAGGISLHHQRGGGPDVAVGDHQSIGGHFGAAGRSAAIFAALLSSPLAYTQTADPATLRSPSDKPANHCAHARRYSTGKSRSGPSQS